MTSEDKLRIYPILSWSQAALVIGFAFHVFLFHPKQIDDAKAAGRAQAVKDIAARKFSDCEDQTLAEMAHMILEDAH